jgi:hypothetical protein
MKDTLTILQEAIGTGEVVKIKYNGGTKPGSVREIVPKEIAEDKLLAHCLSADMDLTFSIYKIEIASASEKVNFDDPPDTLMEVLKDLYFENKDELKRHGWRIICDENSVGLAAEGKFRDICITFSEGYAKPWTVSGLGKTTTFKNSDGAVKRFLEYGCNYFPKKFAEKQISSVTSNNPEPLNLVDEPKKSGWWKWLILIIAVIILAYIFWDFFKEVLAFIVIVFFAILFLIAPKGRGKFILRKNHEKSRRLGCK